MQKLKLSTIGFNGSAKPSGREKFLTPPQYHALSPLGFKCPCMAKNICSCFDIIHQAYGDFVSVGFLYVGCAYLDMCDFLHFPYDPEKIDTEVKRRNNVSSVTWVRPDVKTYLDVVFTSLMAHIPLLQETIESGEISNCLQKACCTSVYNVMEKLKRIVDELVKKRISPVVKNLSVFYDTCSEIHEDLVSTRSIPPLLLRQIESKKSAAEARKCFFENKKGNKRVTLAFYLSLKLWRNDLLDINKGMLNGEKIFLKKELSTKIQ